MVPPPPPPKKKKKKNANTRLARTATPRREPARFPRHGKRAEFGTSPPQAIRSYVIRRERVSAADVLSLIGLADLKWRAHSRAPTTGLDPC